MIDARDAAEWSAALGAAMIWVELLSAAYAIVGGLFAPSTEAGELADTINYASAFRR